MTLKQRVNFKEVAKKLPNGEKKDLDQAIEAIKQNPLLGDLKRGSLTHVRVFKFLVAGQLSLLAYIYDESSTTITLLALGSIESYTAT